MANEFILKRDFDAEFTAKELYEFARRAYELSKDDNVRITITTRMRGGGGLVPCQPAGHSIIAKWEEA